MPAGWLSGGRAVPTAVVAAPGPIPVEVQAVSALEPAVAAQAGAASVKAATAAEMTAMMRRVPGMAVPPILIDLISRVASRSNPGPGPIIRWLDDSYTRAVARPRE